MRKTRLASEIPKALANDGISYHYVVVKILGALKAILSATMLSSLSSLQSTQAKGFLHTSKSDLV